MAKAAKKFEIILYKLNFKNSTVLEDQEIYPETEFSR